VWNREPLTCLKAAFNTERINVKDALRLSASNICSNNQNGNIHNSVILMVSGKEAHNSQ
jgi:hypothetical protein